MEALWWVDHQDKGCQGGVQRWSNCENQSNSRRECRYSKEWPHYKLVDTIHQHSTDSAQVHKGRATWQIVSSSAGSIIDATILGLWPLNIRQVRQDLLELHALLTQRPPCSTPTVWRRAARSQKKWPCVGRFVNRPDHRASSHAKFENEWRPYKR